MEKALEALREENGTLKNHVLRWLNKDTENLDDIKTKLEDLRDGCSTGVVSHLIYYTDTEKFYNRYKSEIERLVLELEASTGKSRVDLFSRSIKIEDWLDNNGTQKKNTLAWFGFEETGHRIYSELFEN
jgi:hypothetical protein